MIEYRWTERIFSLVRIAGGSRVICIKTLQRRTLPRSCWPLDRDLRNDSNRPTQLGGSSLACRSETSAVSTFLTDQRKRTMTDQDQWHSGLDKALFENAWFVLQPPTANFGIAWSWISPFFFQCKPGDSKDKQSNSIEKKRWKFEWTSHPGALARSNEHRPWS